MKTLTTVGLSGGLLIGSETIAEESSSKGKRAEKLIRVEQNLLGSWSGGQSLIPVVHTFHANGQYSFSVAKEFSGGKPMLEAGGWRLVTDDLIAWWTANSRVVAQILRLNHQRLELTTHKGKHVFTRLSQRSTPLTQSNEPT